MWSAKFYAEPAVHYQRQLEDRWSYIFAQGHYCLQYKLPRNKGMICHTIATDGRAPQSVSPLDPIEPGPSAAAMDACYPSCIQYSHILKG